MTMSDRSSVTGNRATSAAAQSLSFDQIANNAPILQNPITISRSGSPTSTPPSTVTLTVENPTQYSSIEWFLGDTPLNNPVTMTLQPSVTINAAGLAAMDHALAIEVVRGGVPYSRTVMLRVVE
jgi:hypothetical protein